MSVKTQVTEDGKLAITYRGETRVFDAYPWEYTSRDGKACKEYRAYRVFFGRFRSGTKVWPVSVTLHDNGAVSMDGGYQNKGGIASITGWFDADSKNLSQANGQR